jgi:serine/threonine protein kinase
LKTKYSLSKNIILTLPNRITELSFSSSSSEAERSSTISIENDGELDVNDCIPNTIPQPSAVSVDYDSIDRRGVIGKGGNAEVTRAIVQNGDTEIELAIKQPHFSETLNTNSAERIFQEARKWEQIGNHDHILTVVDYGGQPVPWIAMEYMNCGHLGERSGVLDISQSLWTALAVTEAVACAHQQNIVHLDLKPQNILFQHMTDAWDVPKVADWELSRNIINNSTGVDGISLNYAAPEQISDEHGELNKKPTFTSLVRCFTNFSLGSHLSSRANMGQ